MEVRTKVDRDTELMPQLRIVFYAACVINSQMGTTPQYIKFSMSHTTLFIEEGLLRIHWKQRFHTDMVTIQTFSYVVEFCEVRLSQYTNYS